MLLHPPVFKILTIKQQDFGKFKKLWFTLDHALDCDTSEKVIHLISIHNLHCLTGQKQVEDAACDGMSCSIKRTTALSSQDLHRMQQACNSGTATLTQDAKVYKSTEISVYEINTCNGSGLEVKDPQALKAWSSSLMPTNRPVASSSGQHACPEQMTTPNQQPTIHDQQIQQTAPQCPQPSLVELPPTLAGSLKRSRISSDTQPQASLHHHCCV